MNEQFDLDAGYYYSIGAEASNYYDLDGQSPTDSFRVWWLDHNDFAASHD